MTDDKSRISRRDVLKGFGIASALAVLSRFGFADTTQTLTETAAPTEKKIEGSHRILSCNILLASPTQDGKPEAWINRRSLTEKIIRNQNADIICLQEVLRPQAVDLQETFSKLNFEAFGFPGPFNDAHPTGYHGVTKNVILFSKDRYEMTSAGNYWLSETPLIAGSQSWDAARGRHVNWVRLKDRQTGREFRVLDTHFDHKGQQSREGAAKMINAESAQYDKDFPQLMAGDFNVGITNPVYLMLTEGGWTDTHTAVHGPADPGRTFHGLKGPDYVTKSKTGKIDFIFCRGKVKPVAAAIIKDNDNGRYPSDHYFISADVEL